LEHRLLKTGNIVSMALVNVGHGHQPMKMLWNTAVETLLCHRMRIRTIPNKGPRSTYSLTSRLIQPLLAKCTSAYRKPSSIPWTTSCSYFDLLILSAKWCDAF
jgi:hypothetical protein